jgi:glyoxylase-like metal-dependent hydrolase (beta-lactamase superfamily II)
MRIHRIGVPTPFYIGPVNVYLIDEDPLTVIDTGPRTDEAINALKSGLAKIGRRLSEIRRVIITHAHADHFGLARVIREESGAAVLVHAWDAPFVLGLPDYERRHELLVEAGVPAEVIQEMAGAYWAWHAYSCQLDEVEVLQDGDDILFERESLTVVHTPGHTPGSICLLRASTRLVFSSDTVLKNITPNPVLNADPIDPRRRFQSLGEYLVSLARIRSLAPTLLKGGHGEDVNDMEEYFNRLRRFTEQRQSRLLSLIPRHGATGWEMALRLFPNVGGPSRFLAVSEAMAHLDYAVAEGKLVVEQLDGKDVYRLPG